jgi:hypothetical protein
MLELTRAQWDLLMPRADAVGHFVSPMVELTYA